MPRQCFCQSNRVVKLTWYSLDVMVKKIEQISDTFNRTVKELKFNEGVKDRRMKVVFHTLRHTYASLVG